MDLISEAYPPLENPNMPVQPPMDSAEESSVLTVVAPTSAAAGFSSAMRSRSFSKDIYSNFLKLFIKKLLGVDKVVVCSILQVLRSFLTTNRDMWRHHISCDDMRCVSLANKDVLGSAIFLTTRRLLHVHTFASSHVPHTWQQGCAGNF